jgi:hypothetical protein
MPEPEKTVQEQVQEQEQLRSERPIAAATLDLALCSELNLLLNLLLNPLFPF